MDDVRAREYFDNPDHYVAGNPYIRFRSSLIGEMMPGLSGKSILDVGAGNGEVTLPFLDAANQVTFLDASQEMLRLIERRLSTEQRSRAHLIRSELMSFTTESRHDLVVCVGVLAHVADWRLALGRLASWVAPSGQLVIQFTDDASWLGAATHALVKLKGLHRDGPQHVHGRMTATAIYGELRELGFRPLGTQRYSFIPGLRRLPSRMSDAIVARVHGFALSRKYGGEVVAAFSRDH